MDLKGAEVRNFYSLTNKMGQTGSDNNVSFIKIPHYQRPYKWTESEVKNLITDCLNIDSEYFAGSVVTVIDPEKNTHELIDGQQRFTTIFIANYILMLLLRVSVREALSQTESFKISRLEGKLKTAIQYLYVGEDNNYIDDILDMTKVEKVFNEKNPDDKNALINQYCKNVFLPIIVEDDQSYADTYAFLLEEAFQGYANIRLKYDRKSYNDLLISSLSKLVVSLSNQSGPSLSIHKGGGKITDIENSFLTAAQTVFDVVESKCTGAPLDKSIKIIENLEKFLKYVKLCVIQTGNPKDAYILFEVMNDRSLALDDLDLIKNMFYRAFCHTSGLPDNVLDRHIAQVEELWGTIFDNKSEANKKLITFLSAVYLTGSQSIDHKAHTTHRESIKGYLDKFTASTPYTEDIFLRDINVFRSVSDLVDIFEVVKKNRDKKALGAEYDINVSSAYKTSHFLLSISQESVFSGLVCYILNYIQYTESCSDFDQETVKYILGNIKKKSGDEKLNNVNKQAQAIWRCAMKCSDYKEPRKLSSDIVSDCNVDKNNQNHPHQHDCCDNQYFETWLNNWQYSPSSSNTSKIKILFARILKLDVDSNGHLEDKPFGLSLGDEDVRKMHLDHMEPQEIDETHKSAYSMMTDSDRDFYVNGLGNMIPLPGNVNQSKSNKPMDTSFTYLESSGLQSHWLVKETKDLLASNSNTVGDHIVPKKSFFQKRRNFIVHKFIEAVDMYK